jgi:hypothetical protein
LFDDIEGRLRLLPRVTNPNIRMKIYSPFIVALVLATGAYGQASGSSQSQGSNPVQVSVESEAKDLARGYAIAFSQLSRPPLTLAFQRDGALRVLEDVKGVRAAEGALVVEVGRGLIYVINAKDVLYLTDGPQVPFRSLATK